MRELLLLSAAISGVLSLVMVFFLRRHRGHPGFAHWTGATALVTVEYLLLALRGPIPEVASVVGVNAAMIAASPIFLDGTRRFLGLAPASRAWFVFAGGAFAVCMFFTLVHDDIALRTAVLMAACSAPFLAIVALVAGRREVRRSPLAGALALQLLLIVAALGYRAGWALGHPGFSILSRSAGQFAFFVAAVVLHLGVTVTWILMLADRLITQLAGASAELGARVEQLERALSEVKTLRGLLPICASCKKIRDEHDTWVQMEVYVRDRSQAEFTHGLCPECLPKFLSLPPR